MPSNKPPRKGTAARTIYDCLEKAPKGMTIDEIERACGPLKNTYLRLNEMRGKGLIHATKQDGGDVWSVSVQKEEKKKAPKKQGTKKKTLDEGPMPCECPACGATVLMILRDPKYGGECVYVNPQRRIIVFAGPWAMTKYTDPETGREETARLPKEPLVLLEEETGRHVIGRQATAEEREYFAEHKKLRKPWTIGHETHLTTCSGWKRWLNGKAEEKRRTWEMKWDKTKKRYSFTREEDEPRKSMMSEDTSEPKGG